MYPSPGSSVPSCSPSEHWRESLVLVSRFAPCDSCLFHRIFESHRFGPTEIVPFYFTHSCHIWLNLTGYFWWWTTSHQAFWSHNFQTFRQGGIDDSSPQMLLSRLTRAPKPSYHFIDSWNGLVVHQPMKAEGPSMVHLHMNWLYFLPSLSTPKHLVVKTICEQYALLFEKLKSLIEPNQFWVLLPTTAGPYY